jgi:hypothetical protein
MYPLRPGARGVCVCVCVCVQCDIYLSILDGLSIYLSMYLVCISDLYVPGPCRARGACVGVCHVCVCVCVCVCFNYLRLF